MSVELIKKWALDPESFCREALFIEDITSQQLDALVAIKDLVTAKIKASKKSSLTDREKELVKKIGISIQSGQGTGKDAFASWMIIWFLCCMPYPKIPCTATSAKQLNQVLWAEISKWLRYSTNQAKKKGLENSFPSSVLTHQSEKVYLSEFKGKEWFAVARTVNVKGSADEQAETLAGYHEDYQMIIVDEASGVPDPVFKPLEGTLTGICNFAVLIFNPTRSQGFAIDSHSKSRDQWCCLQWDAEDSERVTREHIERMEKKYGRDSNAFRTRVKGLPPLAEPDTLIPWDWVMRAVDRDISVDEDMPVVYGVDVARQGDDKSIILKKRGPVIEEIKQFSKIDTMELAGWVASEMSIDEPAGVYIDVIGMGYGVFDRLKEMGKYNVYSVNVAEQASRNDKFYRLRDELWWNIREAFEKNLISIPNDDELIGELTTIKFEMRGAVVKIESKRDMKKRGLLSPNKADALCLSYFMKDSFHRVKETPYSKYRNQIKPQEDSWMAA